MLVWMKGNIKKTVSVLQYCVPKNGAQRYEQFLQIVHWTFILLGLALYLQSASVSSVFMVLYIYFNDSSCSVTFSAVPRYTIKVKYAKIPKSCIGCDSTKNSQIYSKKR